MFELLSNAYSKECHSGKDGKRFARKLEEAKRRQRSTKERERKKSEHRHKKTVTKE